MRLLILTTSHRLGEGDQLMSNELAGALIERGHAVDVALLDWMGTGGAPRVVRGSNGEDVLLIPPTTAAWAPILLRRAIKWLGTPLRGGRAFAACFGSRRYDAVVVGTPASLFAPFIRRLLRGKGPLGILFIHDFFPVHHHEIGLVPALLEPSLRRLEERMMARFDIIYCNLPTNIAYLKEHYRLPGDQLVSWTPLWTRVDPVAIPDRDAIRTRHRLPADRPIAVFGGQIIEGRGIEEMLKVAALAQAQGSRQHFLFVGSGRLSPLVEAEARRSGSNVSWIAQIPRADYLGIISACDVGMIATVPGVSSHSFPTKLMDYLRVGIPAVVAVEPGSAFAAMVEEAGVGFSLRFGDTTGFLAAIERATSDQDYLRQVPAAARRLLEDILDVRQLAVRLEADIMTRQSNSQARTDH